MQAALLRERRCSLALRTRAELLLHGGLHELFGRERDVHGVRVRVSRDAATKEPSYRPRDVLRLLGRVCFYSAGLVSVQVYTFFTVNALSAVSRARPFLHLLFDHLSLSELSIAVARKYIA